MRRRHRRYGSMVQIPGLGVLNKAVNTTDVLMGAAVGLGGTLLMKGFGNKMFAGRLPDWVLKGSPLVGGALTGGALYFFEKNKNMARADAHLFGALMAGAAIQAWDVLKTSFPSGLGDVVSLKLGRYGGGYGVLVDENTPRGMAGLIVDESKRNLNELAAMSMGDGEGSGLEELMEMD